MKLFMPLILFILPAFVEAQTYKEQREKARQIKAVADTVIFPSPYQYAFIDTVSLSKKEIYSRCYQWMATNTTNYKLGLQMQDSSLGKIVVPGITSVYNSQYQYDLVIDARDGKYRCSFNSFIYKTDYRATPFDSLATMKMLFMSDAGKRSFWQVEKFHEREEVESIFAQIKTFVRKKDDF